MTETKFSDFKMFEKAPYDIPDQKVHMNAQLISFREIEKLYGPVFATLLIKYALQFIAQRIGEKPPEDIKTLDQLVNYLLSKTDKYPLPINACCYAQLKAENELQGQTGTTQRVTTTDFQRKHGKSSISEEININLDDIMSKLYQLGIDMKLGPKELGYRTSGNEILDLLLPDCFHRDICRQALKENLVTRTNGTMYCILGVSMCQFFKMATSYEWDYELLEFDKPQCIIRYYIF